jgi:lysine 2,3-aminomutase
MSPTVFKSRRAPVFREVPEAQWKDWRWQLSHRLNTVEEIGRVFPLTESERTALGARDLFRVDVTPYFISLIRPDDPGDPIRRQVIPTAAELVPYTAMMEDSLAEDRHSPVPGLVHRYPDRVLMLVTTQCASYCRYCTRSRIVGDPAAQFSRAEFDAMFAYIERTPQIRCAALRRRSTHPGAGPVGKPDRPPARHRARGNHPHRNARTGLPPDARG